MLCLRCLVDASLDVVCRNVSNPSPPIFQHEARSGERRFLRAFWVVSDKPLSSDDTEPCVVEARQILEANDACERGPFELRRGHGILKRQRTLADRRKL